MVAPGRMLNATHLFIVLRGDPQPQFSNRSMDFDFAAAPPSAGFGAAAVAHETAPVATPEQQNIFWQSIVDSSDPADFESYLERFPNCMFRSLAQNRLRALEKTTRAGPALTAPSASPARPEPPPAPEAPPRPSRPVCDETLDGWDDPPCWLKLASHPDCHVWNTNYTPHKPVSWSGGCVEGSASGKGTATGTPVWFWEHDYSCSSAEAALGYCPPYECVGMYVNGKREGRWTEKEAQNSVLEGPHVDGKRHGERIEHRDGKVYRHRYIHGKYQE